MKLFDLHCDTIYECCETGKHLRENDLHINYAAAHRYQPYVAVFCAVLRRETAVFAGNTRLSARYAR